VPSPPRIGRRSPRSRRLLLGALGLLVALGLVDLLIGSVIFVPLFVLAPLVVALRGTPSETAIAAAGALAMAVVSGTWNSALGTGRWWVGLLLVAVGGLGATAAAATRRRLERDAARLELLVELGDAASDAAVDETAARLGELLVPAVGDVCVIELAGDDGARRVVCARAVDELGPDAAARLAAEPALAVAPDEPALLDPVSGSNVTLRSCVGVPLHARGRTIGTLRLGVGPSGRRFGPRDLRFAEVLADGVALALENAGLSAELVDAERRFRAIVDGMLDGVTVRAADGRLVYANDAAIDLLRAPSREMLRGLAPGETMARFEVYDEHGRPV
jgi:PAS domain-containing protein